MTRSSVLIPSVSCCLSSCLLVTTILFFLVVPQECSTAYYGKLIGKLSEFHHAVSGEVYAVDGRTLYIKDFTYDGEGPAAFFYAGNSKGPNGNGFRIRDERGTSDVLKRYRKKDITLTLPEGKTLNNIKWFSIYCDEFAVNFGDVRIPRSFDYPKPQKLAALNGVHGVNSEPIVVVDSQTLLIPGFSYDGEAPDAKFWVGSGQHPSPQGIRVPDENGKNEPLRRYDRKTIVLTLPGDLTVHQLGHFGVWCEAFTVDFGHIQILPGLNVPPSLKMLGVSPQNLRERQRQTTGGLAALLASPNPQTLTLGSTRASSIDYSSSRSGSASSTAATPSLLSLLLTTQKYERPTTYRPAILRRSDDHVQVIKSVDYQIPKILQSDETFYSSAHQQRQVSDTNPTHSRSSTSSTVHFEDGESFSMESIGRDNSKDHTTTQPYQSGNQPSQLDSQKDKVDSQRIIYPGGSLAYYRTLDTISRATALQQHPYQQSSYSRLRTFQGDQSVDSYVRY